MLLSPSIPREVFSRLLCTIGNIIRGNELIQQFMGIFETANFPLQLDSVSLQQTFYSVVRKWSPKHLIYSPYCLSNTWYIPHILPIYCLSTVSQTPTLLTDELEMSDREAIVLILMLMVNDKQIFSTRVSALYCVQCFLFKNPKGQASIVTTLLPNQDSELLVDW